jgi:hypothetical protein
MAAAVRVRWRNAGDHLAVEPLVELAQPLVVEGLHASVEGLPGFDLTQSEADPALEVRDFVGQRNQQWPNVGQLAPFQAADNSRMVTITELLLVVTDALH